MGSCFVDDFSRYTWLYLLRHRSDVLSIYRQFSEMIFTQFGKRIKVFRSNGAREYLSSAFRDVLASHGTLSQQSCPYTPAQNGVAERKHRHILETARALLLSASVPRHSWAEAIMTSVYIINRTPSIVLAGVTPFERLHSCVPSYSHLRTFGCVCFVLLPSIERTKLSPRSAMCVLLGYSSEHKGYRCYDLCLPHQPHSIYCSF